MAGRIVRGISGFLVLVSLLLSYLADPKWMWLAGFVGVMLLQSAFTDWCPMIKVLKKMGIKAEANSCCPIPKEK
ncbi:MAG: DUF2892 domain-containing protein [Candidatus Omnitrophica bacterium]|nr:DUF2892 domain-containing protein [Candidatus Omnitrophota bacterium]